MHNISNLFYFGTTLYMFRTVRPSVRHQESKTLHTASGICHTGSVAVEFHLVPASKQPQNLYVIYLMLYVQS